MYFAQFYDYAVGSNELIPACGVDGVMLLDGRWSFDHMIKSVVESGGGFKQYPAFDIQYSSSGRYSDGIPMSWKIFIRKEGD